MTKKNNGRPVGVIAISLVVACEALMLAAAGALIVRDALGAKENSPGLAAGRFILLSGWFFICAVFIALLGHYFFRGRRWTRSPILVWQLLAAAVSFSNVQTGVWPFVTVSCAAVIMLLLFTKPVTQFLTEPIT